MPKNKNCLGPAGGKVSGLDSAAGLVSLAGADLECRHGLTSGFHSFWYAESFKWAQLDGWAGSAGSVNGWLRSLLWTESAEVIQAYGSACAGYSLVFFTGHFAWALSLMFLFTGRGYWQELLESVSWAHVKLHLAPTIQPRALSITTGRAVGVTHYLAGAIGASWAFSTCRLVA